MKPMSFDPATAREIVGDLASRKIEEKARKDADGEFYDPTVEFFETYWNNVQNAMQVAVYKEQFAKRLSRNSRKSNVERR